MRLRAPVGVVLLLGFFAAFAQAAPTEPYLPDLMEQPAHRAAWKSMLAGQPVPPWVKTFDQTLNATASPVEPVSVGGIPYTLGWICKPHDCGDNQLYVLFAPEARQAWGLLITGNARQWLGNPDAAVQAAIESKVQ